MIYGNKMMISELSELIYVFVVQVGICGRTGSGKSSLFRLLFKILDVTAGEIIIDGVNLSNVSISQAR